MKSKIIEQRKNEFLGRNEFLLEIFCESAPKKSEIIEELGKDKELTVINRVNSFFGKNIFIADIYVYDNLESKQKFMIVPKKVRDKLKKEKNEDEKKKREIAKAEKLNNKNTTEEGK